eukprot:g27578.t1
MKRPKALNRRNASKMLWPNRWINSEIGGDEAAFIREENRLLRRQLEDHPEVQRLRAENWALREELRTLDPAGEWFSHAGSGVAKKTGTLAEEESMRRLDDGEDQADNADSDSRAHGLGMCTTLGMNVGLPNGRMLVLL